MGMRTDAGYVEGTEERPARNKAVRAIEAAMDEVGGFDPEEADVTYCVPRHLGASDHESFHLSGIDSVNVCFRGNVEEGGHWPNLCTRSATSWGILSWTAAIRRWTWCLPRWTAWPAIKPTGIRPWGGAPGTKNAMNRAKKPKKMVYNLRLHVL